MRASIQLIALAIAWFFQAPPTPAPPAFHAFSYDSQVLGASRAYRVALPAGYEKSRIRYPVVYWMHTEPAFAEAVEKKLAGYAATHEVILVDGGASNAQGQLPLYFPELVEQIDATLRTTADRGHRAISGIGSGGFLALFLAGKYPGLLGSASTISGVPEGDVGPEGFPSEYNHDNFALNYDGVRVRMANSTADSWAFYHRRMDSIWAYLRASYQNASFLAGQDMAEIDRTLDFQLASFATPLPAPTVFNHADAYPSFQIWGWDVVSNRRQPGLTLLENVSNQGFRSSVRESLPGGATLPEVTLSVSSAPIYPPGVALTVTYIRLADGNVRKMEQRADAHGKLNFQLTGDAYEIAVANTPLLTITGYTISNANWATAGKALSLRVRFWNKGSVASGTSLIHWQSPNPGVKFETPEGRLYALQPGESAWLPVSFTVNDPQRAIVKIAATSGSTVMPLEVPLYPAAEPIKDFQIADGRTLTVFRHAVQKDSMRLGEGNGDGHAGPGESFAVLIPEGGALRMAEIFTNDTCVDNMVRGNDSWSDYDHSGASAAFSVPSIRLDCEPGHVVHMLTRILIPNGPDTRFQYGTLEFPVWYRNEGK